VKPWCNKPLINNEVLGMGNDTPCPNNSKICGKEPCYSKYILPGSWLFIVTKFHCTGFSLRADTRLIDWLWANFACLVFDHQEKVFVVKRFSSKCLPVLWKQVVFLLKMSVKPLKLMAQSIRYFLMRLLLGHCTIIMLVYIHVVYTTIL